MLNIKGFPGFVCRDKFFTIRAGRGGFVFARIRYPFSYLTRVRVIYESMIKIKGDHPVFLVPIAGSAVRLA